MCRNRPAHGVRSGCGLGAARPRRIGGGGGCSSARAWHSISAAVSGRCCVQRRRRSGCGCGSGLLALRGTSAAAQ